MKAKDKVSTFLSKLSHVRRFLFPGKEQIIEAFFSGLDVEKIQEKYRIPSFTIKKILEKHQSKISEAKSRIGPKSQIGPKSHIGPKNCMEEFFSYYKIGRVTFMGLFIFPKQVSFYPFEVLFEITEQKEK